MENQSVETPVNPDTVLSNWQRSLEGVTFAVLVTNQEFQHIAERDKRRPLVEEFDVGAEIQREYKKWRAWQKLD